MGICCCLLDPQTNSYQAECADRACIVGKPYLGITSRLPVTRPESNCFRSFASDRAAHPQRGRRCQKDQMVWAKINSERFSQAYENRSG
jgi:hypothetical protein